MKTSSSPLLFAMVIFAVLCWCNACGLKDAVDEVTDTATNLTAQISQDLDQGISDLNSQSANWQEILNNTIKNLPDETSQIIRGELNNLLQRTVAATGSEFRCDADFIRVRIQQGLQQIKNKLLNLPSTPPEPHFCSDVPTAIDMSLDANSRNKLEFYGYDFDKATQQVLLVSGSNTTDVTQYLDQTTHYHMILNLGSNGVKLDKNAQRIVLRWNNQDVSSVPVIQPAPKICETEFKQFTPQTITYIPPRYGSGDKEYDGNGPRTSCKVTLVNYGNRVTAKIYMDAIETKSDFTRAFGSKEYVLYNADPGKTIEKIVSPTYASFAYTDTDLADDLYGGDGCIASFKFVGDTKDDDVGETSVTVVFNSIRVQLKETGDCVSTETIKALNGQEKISPALKRQASPLLETKPSKAN